MADRIKQVAFLMECPGCDKGMMRLGKTEFTCIRCNGHGMYIKPTDLKAMSEYIKSQGKFDILKV
jgi:hypothetical protein